MSTSLTVLREETDETHSLESMELSQKQRDFKENGDPNGYENGIKNGANPHLDKNSLENGKHGTNTGQNGIQ